MSKFSIIDLNNTTQYCQNIWNPKYGLGLYFSGLQELGILIHIDMFLKIEGRVEKYRAFHALHDAFSALTVLNKERQLDLNIAGPTVRPVKRRLTSLLSALRSKPTAKLYLPQQTPYTASTEGQWHTLEIPPLTAFEILNTVTKILAPRLTKNNTLRWQIPCRIGNKPGMMASYFGLKVSTLDGVEKTKLEYKMKLQSEEHWGFYYLAKLGLIFGKWGVRRGTKKTLSSQKKVWFGSLSNLGDLGESLKIDELRIHPAVRWHRPVGLMMYSFNQKSYLTIGLHESLQQYDLSSLMQELGNAFKP